MEQTFGDLISAVFGKNELGGMAQAATLAPLFMSGGITVWLIANLKNIWAKFASAVLSVISFTVVNKYEDARGRGLCLYIRQKMFNEVIQESREIWSRTSELDLSYSMNDSGQKTVIPYGTSLRLILGKPVICARSVQSGGQQVMATTTLRVFFARKKKWTKAFDRLIDEAADREDRRCWNLDYLMVNRSDQKTKGMFSLKHQKRKLGTIFSDGDVHLKLFDEVKRFIDGKDEYFKMDYPWKFCALLHGRPGCGKTSTILAIASALGRDVWYIDIKNTTPSDLANALAVSDHYVYVFEDIDAACSSSPIASREGGHVGQSASEQQCGGLSLADLLNVTDGFLSGFGSICMFTTNHVEKLDPALIRPGRMNSILEMKYLSSDMAGKMIEYQLGHRPGFKLADDICPASLQQDLLTIKMCRLDENEVLEKYKA